MPACPSLPLPLDGFTIGVTANRQHEQQLALLRGLGADCVHAPLVTTTLRPVDVELQKQIRQLAQRPPKVSVFVTRLGVTALLDSADALGVGPAVRLGLVESTVAARTLEVRSELEAHGIATQLCPESASMFELADMVASTLGSGDRLLLSSDSGEEQIIAETAKRAGALVEEVRLYSNVLNPDPDGVDRLVRSVCSGQIDALTFTTRPSVRAFVMRSRHAGLLQEVQLRCEADVSLFAKGPVARFSTIDFGLGQSSTPKTSRIGSLVDHVCRSLTKRHIVIDFDDGQLRVQGTRAWARGGEPLDLTPRERGVLMALAQDPGVVWSKQRLLGTVWQSADATEHAVEVTVNRLRRRLGSSSHWIKTVPKRGYSLAVRCV